MAFTRRGPIVRLRTPKREGAWVGNLAQGASLGQTVVYREIWGPPDTKTYLTAGHITHQVTHLTLAVPNANGVAGTLFWGVKVYDTDATQVVPGALFLDPSDPATLDQEWMDWGFRFVQPSAAGNGSSGLADFTVHREIRAKRRFSDTQSVGLTLIFQTAGTLTYTVGYRTFCRVAKP